MPQTVQEDALRTMSMLMTEYATSYLRIACAEYKEQYGEAPPQQVCDSLYSAAKVVASAQCMLLVMLWARPDDANKMNKFLEDCLKIAKES